MEAAMESLRKQPAIEGVPPFLGKGGESRKDAAETGSAAGPCRVLVVEDDPFLAAFYTHLLHKKNIPADQCADGGKALERLAAIDYDLVILDVNLPGLDGISLARWLQRHRPATCTVIISGDASPDKIQAVMRAGARDYLQKPFTIGQFWGMLDRCYPPSASSWRQL